MYVSEREEIEDATYHVEFLGIASSNVRKPFKYTWFP
jgi:hypothetical protein